MDPEFWQAALMSAGFVAVPALVVKTIVLRINTGKGANLFAFLTGLSIALVIGFTALTSQRLPDTGRNSPINPGAGHNWLAEFLAPLELHRSTGGAIFGLAFTALLLFSFMKRKK